jgi:hypothetical protein
VSEAPPCIESQIGRLHFSVVLDSGSACSPISFKHFEQIGIDGLGPKLEPTQVKCVSASGQGLAIVGEVHIRVKIHGFSWPWAFLVTRNR